MLIYYDGWKMFALEEDLRDYAESHELEFQSKNEYDIWIIQMKKKLTPFAMTVKVTPYDNNLHAMSIYSSRWVTNMTGSFLFALTDADLIVPAATFVGNKILKSEVKDICFKYFDKI